MAEVPPEEAVSLSFTDPDRLLKLILLVNMVGILSLGAFVVITDDGPTVADRIGGSLGGNNSARLIQEERAAALQLGPLLEMKALSVPLSGPTQYTLTLTLTVEVEDEQALGDLERRQVRARYVMKKLLATKRPRAINGTENMERIRGELVDILNTIMPNGQVVQVWPQAWLVE